MPNNYSSRPAAVYKCQDCGEQTLHYRACPNCGSEDLKPAA